MPPVEGTARNGVCLLGEFMSCLYCARPAKARGLCDMHWERWRHSRPMEAPFRIPKVWVAQGYRFVWANSTNKGEHRVIMERHLGRSLHIDECVHHKNGNKTDNRLENLEVVGRAAHTSLHRPKRRPCGICGVNDPHQSHGFCGKHYWQLKGGAYAAS